MTLYSRQPNESSDSSMANSNSGSNFTDAASLRDAVNLGLIHMETAHYLGDKVWLTVIFGICLSTTAVCGVFGNILIMLSVATDKFLRQPGNVFIINLALADFLVALIVDPFNVVGAVYGAKFFNDHHWLCIIVGVVCTPSCVTSLYSIMAVGVNRFSGKRLRFGIYYRYIRICKYQYYHRIYSWRVSIAMCAGAWACGLMIHFPNHVGWGSTGYDADYYVCAFSIHTYSYALFWLGCSVVIPSVVITFCYTRIFSHFKSSRATMAAHRQAVPVLNAPSSLQLPHQSGSTATKQASDDYHTTPSSATFNLNNNSKTSANKKTVKLMRSAGSKEDDERKLLRSLFLVLVAFLVCWTPFVVLVAAGSPRWVPGWVYVITVIMAHGNSTVNVFIYGFTNRHFRIAYKRLILCRPCRGKRHQHGNRVGAVASGVNNSMGETQSRTARAAPVLSQQHTNNNSVRFMAPTDAEDTK